MHHLVFIFLFNIYDVASGQVTASIRDVGCCTDCACCTKNTISGTCPNCKDGYHGMRCTLICPDKCPTCSDHPNTTKYPGHANCTYCTDGYYSTAESFQCMTLCSDGCKNCVSFMNQEENCQVCKDGYYLVLKTANTGKCDKCPSNCRTCTSVESCESCSLGYFGKTCNKSCSLGCKDAVCDKGTGQCTNGCVSEYFENTTTCDSCKAGKYGFNCTKTCSSVCLNKICEKYTSACLSCAGNFNGSQCDKCIDGYHGTYCNKTCSVFCGGAVCQQQSGDCVSCKEGFTGKACNTCIDGKFGSNCDLICPENCLNNICNQSTGYCEECADNFSGQKCDSCKNGFYGQKCSSTCSESCRDGTCNHIDGTCSSCVPGRYGAFCGRYCPQNCLNTDCHSETGLCTNGCKSGYSGNKCCANYSNCLICSSSEMCMECILGMYGDACNESCKFNCVENKCHKDNGTCLKCQEPYEGLLCNGTSPTSEMHQGGLGNGQNVAIAGSVAAVFVILSVVVVIFFLYRRKSNVLPCFKANETVYENAPDNNENLQMHTRESRYETTNSDERVNVEASINDNDEAAILTRDMGRIDHSRPVERHPLVAHAESATVAKRINTNPQTDTSRKVKLEHLIEYIKEKPESFFISEFQELPKGLMKPCLEARKPENIIRNRYNAVYPYDETRVVLFGAGPDFINACYIDGYKQEREYIASLGPTLKNMDNFYTFWQMVWQEHSQTIVMVTNLKENKVMKCEQYWPDPGHSLCYGEVQVTCLQESAFAEYTVRLLQVSKGSDQRIVHHVHFTAWPDKGVPDDVTSLIEFRQKVRAIKSKSSGPTIVHCSAGVGRTGTYIALDLLTKEGEADHAVDVFGCVCNLRQQRTSMVQTWEQYEYLHHAVVHSLTFGCEALTAEEFEEYVSSSSDVLMEHKFQQLQNMGEKLSKDEVKAIAKNKNRRGVNRIDADVPGNRYRVRLFRDGRDDYINATNLNSFKDKNKYIVTQTPMDYTLEDFLVMIIQENVSCIVSMDENKSWELYLPNKERVLTFGAFTIKTMKVQRDSSVDHRKLLITVTSELQEEITREVHFFRCNHWPDDDPIPQSPTQFLHLIQEVDKWAGDRPIIIHCLTAAVKSGLFCAVSMLVQKMEIEHEVSVVNVLRKVKVRRSLAIPNKHQYKFCYLCVCELLQGVDKKVYSNT